MLYLADFSVIKPDPGLIFWTSIIFIVLYFILGRFAFKPIQKALKKRDTDIQESIDEAKRVKAEMAQLKADNQALLAEAREESMRIKREAEAAANQIITAAKEDAKAAQQKIAADAKRDIDNMRKAALVDLKQQVGNMAIDIAEKVIRKELQGDAGQQALVKELVSNLN
ncbi:MAG: F0F1 ATP synthase subunit B [Bacteroidota bacterium]